MWNAIVTQIDNNSAIQQINNLTIGELQTWLDLQVPSLKFAELKAQTQKDKGLNVELDDTYHVVVRKAGVENKLPVKVINTTAPEDMPEDEEEEVEPESFGLPNLQTLSQAEAIKAINEVKDPAALEALKLQESEGKKRAAVTEAIAKALK